MNYADGDSANTGSGTLPNSEQIKTIEYNYRNSCEIISISKSSWPANANFFGVRKCRVE